MMPKFFFGQGIAWALLVWAVSVLGAVWALGVGTALAQTPYQIRIGDRLQVTVVEDASLNITALVAPDGTISVPAAGALPVSGLTTVAVERALRNRLSTQFQMPPTVSVALVELGPLHGMTPRRFQVFVVGEVNGAGALEVEPGTTILQALSLAGGLTQFAASRRIQLRRVDLASGRDQVTLFNYRAVERGAPITVHVTLRPGDVIVVPERGLFE